MGSFKTAIAVLILALVASITLLTKTGSITSRNNATAGSNLQTSQTVAAAANTSATQSRDIAAASAAAGVREPSASIDSWLATHWPGNWQIVRRDDGTVASLLGTSPAGAIKNSREAASVAREIATSLAIDARTVSPEPSRTDSTDLSRSYDFSQTAAGFEVYQAGLTIFTRKADGAVYLVNNDLRPLTEFNPQPRVSATEATGLLTERYSGRDARITPQGNAPVLWAEGLPNELAWRFTVELKASPVDRLEVLVAAQSGRILVERSLIID